MKRGERGKEDSISAEKTKRNAGEGRGEKWEECWKVWGRSVRELRAGLDAGKTKKKSKLK